MTASATSRKCHLRRAKAAYGSQSGLRKAPQGAFMSSHPSLWDERATDAVAGGRVDGAERVEVVRFENPIALLPHGRGVVVAEGHVRIRIDLIDLNLAVDQAEIDPA